MKKLKKQTHNKHKFIICFNKFIIMGSNFSSGIGIDSIQFIDENITYLLFQAPLSNDCAIRNLALEKNHHLKNINGFSTLEIKPESEKAKKILIFSHGNGCDILGMKKYLKNLADNLGITVVCYDYTGYGLSKGKPSEENCNLALESVINYYKNMYDESEITLVGQSLGTGVVSHYISKNNWKTPVILISPYKSIPRVICDIPYVESCFRHNTFSTIYNIKNIKCPLKIFHGLSDDVISCYHGKYIADNMPNKTFDPTFYPNTGHNDILEALTFQDYSKVIFYNK